MVDLKAFKTIWKIKCKNEKVLYMVSGNSQKHVRLSSMGYFKLTNLYYLVMYFSDVGLTLYCYPSSHSVIISHSRRKFEERWTIYEDAFNVPDLSLDRFVPRA
ncbi:hypothetical protein YC2023_060174 [Brassica napus]